MASPPGTKDAPAVTPTRPVAVLIKQAGASAPDALERGLRAAGLDVVLAPSPLDAVTESARTPGGLRYLVLGVDYFGPEQFRLFPLFRREWPDTVLVAYHSDGFEHKGRIARLVGADMVLARPEDVFYFLETLLVGERGVTVATAPAPAAPESAEEAADTVTPTEVARTEAPPAPAAVEPGPAPAEEAAETDRPPREAGHPDPSEPPREPHHEPPRQAHRAVAEPPVPEPAPSSAHGCCEGDDAVGALAANATDDALLGAGSGPDAIELTDEELRVLLGEDDDA